MELNKGKLNYFTGKLWELRNPTYKWEFEKPYQKARMVVEENIYDPLLNETKSENEIHAYAKALVKRYGSWIHSGYWYEDSGWKQLEENDSSLTA